MATYAIGDIQGCYDSLQALLDRLGYRSGLDSLWLAGDLVNRGPRSLEVLRWAAAEPGLCAVLGNHDLHLLARAAGAAVGRAADTLDALLAAPDAGDLIDWLRRQPLLHRQGRWVLVHAGILPLWDLEQAQRQARAASGVLCGSAWAAAVSSWRAAPRRGWGKQPRDDSTPEERFAFTLNALTRLRVCRADGQMDLRFSGPPDQAPKGLRPWFDLWPRPDETTVLFGHWAALGLFQRGGFAGLDGGCVWGGELVAFRLEDGVVFRQPALECSAGG